MTVGNEAARRRGNCERARVSTYRRDTDIVHENWERGTLIAGLVVAVSFGLMFVAGAML